MYKEKFIMAEAKYLSKSKVSTNLKDFTKKAKTYFSFICIWKIKTFSTFITTIVVALNVGGDLC